MKKIMLTQPLFVSEFSCIGAACRENCCNGWNIVIDKTSYNKYLNGRSIEIKQIAVEYIELEKKNHHHWGKMKFNQQGNCPYLDEKSLCAIYKKLGVKAMSHVCRNYPRVSRTYKKQEKKSLKLSCPEAVRLLLSNPDAMKLIDEVALQPQENDRPDASTEQRLLNLFCANLLLVEQADIENNLYAIAAFLLFAQNQKVVMAAGTSIHQKLPLLWVWYHELIEQLQSGCIADRRQNIVPDDVLQWHLLVRMKDLICKIPSTRGKMIIGRYMNELTRLLGESSGDRCGRIGDLRQAWDNCAKPWLAQHKHVLRNYFLQCIYHDDFPNDTERSPLQVFCLLMADFLFIKSLIAAKAARAGVDQDDFINVIYSYHSLTKHGKSATAAFVQLIDQVKLNDDLSSLKLLV